MNGKAKKESSINIVRNLNKNLYKNLKRYSFKLDLSLLVNDGLSSILNDTDCIKIGIMPRAFEKDKLIKDKFERIDSNPYTQEDFVLMIMASFHEYAHVLQKEKKWEELEMTLGQIPKDLKRQIGIDMCLHLASDDFYRYNYDNFTSEIQAVLFSVIKTEEFLLELEIPPKLVNDVIVNTFKLTRGYLEDGRESIPPIHSRTIDKEQFSNIEEIKTVGYFKLNNFRNFFYRPPDTVYNIEFNAEETPSQNNLNYPVHPEDVMIKIWKVPDKRQLFLSEKSENKFAKEKLILDTFVENLEEYIPNKKDREHFINQVDKFYPMFREIVADKFPPQPKRAFGNLF